MFTCIQTQVFTHAAVDLRRHRQRLRSLRISPSSNSRQFSWLCRFNNSKPCCAAATSSIKHEQTRSRQQELVGQPWQKWKYQALQHLEHLFQAAHTHNCLSPKFYCRSLIIQCHMITYAPAHALHGVGQLAVLTRLSRKILWTTVASAYSPRMALDKEMNWEMIKTSLRSLPCKPRNSICTAVAPAWSPREALLSEMNWEIIGVLSHIVMPNRRCTRTGFWWISAKRTKTVSDVSVDRQVSSNQITQDLQAPVRLSTLWCHTVGTFYNRHCTDPT